MSFLISFLSIFFFAAPRVFVNYAIRVISFNNIVFYELLVATHALAHI